MLCVKIYSISLNYFILIGKKLIISFIYRIFQLLKLHLMLVIKKSVNDFNTNIIYADFNFREWRLVNDEPNSEDISKQMDDHYSIEEVN